MEIGLRAIHHLILTEAMDQREILIFTMIKPHTMDL